MEIIDLILCVFYSGIFLIAMQLEKKLKYILPTAKRNQKIQSLSAAQIQQTKEDQFVRNQHKMQLRILLVTSACILLSWHNYTYKCKNQTLTECFNFPIGYQAFKSTLHAMILNFTVFVGPFYQDYMSSKIKIKFKDMEFNRFRWDEFKRLVMGPVIEEWVFRNLINNLINKDFNNNMIFVFVSGVIYALVHLHNYKRFKKRLEPQKAVLAIVIQVIVTFIFGAYMAFLFTKIQAIGSCFIIHGYCKFMGIPNVVELFRLKQDDPITKKILLFYAGGIAGFIIECALLIE
ncbi:hypothetical protein ABPG72_009045 [Tetrahymena utriculariae]